jgi:hypothetical protein
LQQFSQVRPASDRLLRNTPGQKDHPWESGFLLQIAYGMECAK